MFEIRCEACDELIAVSASIADVVAQAEAAERRGDAGRRDPFWDNSGEWFCGNCAENDFVSRYSGDPAPVGGSGDPLTDYLRLKGEI